MALRPNSAVARNSVRGEMAGALGAALAVLILYGVLLWHDPLLFWNDDYELSILPVFADVARSWSEGHLPLLSPYSWICSNLAGEFQYGTFSIFVNAVVVLIWKLPLTFPQQAAALSMSHLAVLAAGGYVLARGRNLRPALAMMVALVAAANGWIVCWGATDWFGALGAFAWLPWAWWGLERALDPSRGRWRWVWPAPFVYLLIAGGFPYTVVMLAVVIGWLSVRSWRTTGGLGSVWPMAFGAVVGLGMAAPAWLALFDYVHGSARQTQESAAHFQWLVPPAALPAFFMPNWTVKWADFSNRMMPHAAAEMACGFAAPVILLQAILVRGRSLIRHLRWELALLAIVIFLSMLPTANVFRWSFRWLPFVHLVLVISAAESMRFITAEKRIYSGYQSSGSVGFFAATGVMIVMCLAGAGGVYLWPLTAITVGLGAFWFAVDYLLKRRSLVRAWAPCAITFTAFVATYLCVPPNCGVPRYNLDSKLKRVEPLDPERLYLSLYPTPEQTYRRERIPAPFGTVVRPGSTSMWAGARFVNGYSPIRPSGIARELQAAIHGEVPWDVASQLLASQAGAEGFLAEIGVDGVIVAREFGLAPQPEEEWTRVFDSGEGTVYHRTAAPYERVRFMHAPHAGSLRAIEDSRNRVSAEVRIPSGAASARLAFSRPFFRGYQAALNGKRLEVTSDRNLFPIVEIPQNSAGRLVLTYRPWWLVFGSAVALCSVAILIAGFYLTVRGRSR